MIKRNDYFGFGLFTAVCAFISFAVELLEVDDVDDVSLLSMSSTSSSSSSLVTELSSPIIDIISSAITAVSGDSFKQKQSGNFQYIKMNKSIKITSRLFATEFSSLVLFCSGVASSIGTLLVDDNDSDRFR